MKAFNGFKAEANSRKPKQLPAGAYVAKIKGVKVEGQEPDQHLIIRVDVEEGEYKSYFFDRFMREKENSRFEPRYKGDYKLRIPNEANTKALYPESDLKRFNDAIWRIEQSNPGYHWDWDENGLKNLLVGINMQESEFNGFRFTKIARLETVDDVRNGRCQMIQPQAPRGDADDSQFIAPQQQTIDPQSGFEQVDINGVDLPF